MVILDGDVIGSVYKWRNKMRPRKAEWPAGVTINFGGQDWNSDLLTPGPWSFHCLQLLPEPLSWIVQAKQAGFLIFGGEKGLVGTHLLRLAVPSESFYQVTPQPSISFCRDTDQRSFGSV